MVNEIARKRVDEREKFEPSSLVAKGGGRECPPLTARKYGNEALCKVGCERGLRSAGTDRYPRIVLVRVRSDPGLGTGGIEEGGGSGSVAERGNEGEEREEMDGWKRWKRAENTFLTAWYQRVTESYVATWLFGVFQSSRMSASTANGGGGGGGGGSGGGGGVGVGGALTLMGCVREASPPPQNHHQHHQHHRTLGIGEYSTQNSVDPLPKGECSIIRRKRGEKKKKESIDTRLGWD